MGVRITLAGQDVTALADELSIVIQSVLAQGAGSGSNGSGRSTTASFLLRIGPAAKAIGAGQPIPFPPAPAALVRQGEVIIYDASGARVFGGYATQYLDQPNTLQQITQLQAHDYFADLDRQIVNEVFNGMSDTAIIKFLLNKYAPWIDTSQIPTFAAYTFDVRICRAMSVREAIQKIANVTGYQCWVDPYKVFHYIAPTAAVSAPFSLSDIPDFTQSFPHAVTGVKQDDNAILNRIYFYGGNQASGDYTQNLSVQSNGIASTFLLAYYPHPSSDGKVHIYKNGVDLVIGSPFAKDGTGLLKSQGGTADCILNAAAKTLIMDIPLPVATDNFYALYRYQTPLVVVLQDQASQAFFGRTYDGKLEDTSVLDLATAVQRTRAVLAQQTYGLLTINASCYKAGVTAGQLLQIINQVRGLNASYFVQQVNVRPLGAGHFQYDLTLGAWNWGLLDLLHLLMSDNAAQDLSADEGQTTVQAEQVVENATASLTITTSTRASGTYYCGQPGTQSGFFTITS